MCPKARVVGEAGDVESQGPQGSSTASKAKGI